MILPFLARKARPFRAARRAWPRCRPSSPLPPADQFVRRNFTMAKEPCGKTMVSYGKHRVSPWIHALTTVSNGLNMFFFFFWPWFDHGFFIWFFSFPSEMGSEHAGSRDLGTRFLKKNPGRILHHLALKMTCLHSYDKQTQPLHKHNPFSMSNDRLNFWL